jgi:tetratricopeptide (TPR) repeat protein
MELQQTFGSTSVPLGMNPPPGLFAGLGRSTSSKRAAERGSSSTRNRAKPDEVEAVHLELEDVIARLKRGEHLTPHDAGAAFNLGWAYRRLGRWADAVDAFSKAIEFFKQTEGKHRDHNLAATYYMRGYAYASLASKQKDEEARRNFEKAERDYLEAVRLKKDYMIVFCYLGVLYGTQGRFHKAEKALKKAIRLKPRYAGAHHDLGAIYAQSGRPKLALKEFEKAVEYDPKNLLGLRHLAEAYYDAGRWEDARRVLLRVLKFAPEDTDALSKLGGSYLYLGDLEKAEEAQWRILELDRDNATAYGNLGLLCLESGRLGEAAEAYNRALALGHPEPEGMRSSLNGVQLKMLQVIASAYLYMLNYDVLPDVDSLVAQAASVRESKGPPGEVPVEEPSAYFPNQLIGVLDPVVAQLDEVTRFTLAARLFERELLPSGHAARLAGLPRATFLSNLHLIGVAMIDLSPEELEEELGYAAAE